jgi:hypothetical protein
METGPRGISRREIVSKVRLQLSIGYGLSERIGAQPIVPSALPSDLLIPLPGARIPTPAQPQRCPSRSPFTI